MHWNEVQRFVSYHPFEILNIQLVLENFALYSAAFPCYTTRFNVKAFYVLLTQHIYLYVSY
jgi:hypothetical protein